VRADRVVALGDGGVVAAAVDLEGVTDRLGDAAGAVTDGSAAGRSGGAVVQPATSTTSAAAAAPPRRATAQCQKTATAMFSAVRPSKPR